MRTSAWKRQLATEQREDCRCWCLGHPSPGGHWQQRSSLRHRLCRWDSVKDTVQQRSSLQHWFPPPELYVLIIRQRENNVWALCASRAVRRWRRKPM